LEVFLASPSAILNALARGLTHRSGVAVRHTLKRIGRFLANPRVDRRRFYQNLVAYVWPRVAHWPIVPISIDWTYNEKRHPWQSLVASIPIRGRGLPLLVWSFRKDDFGASLSQPQVERAFLRELRRILPHEARVVILADRGFGHGKLLRWIKEELGFEFLIRLPYSRTVLLDGRPCLLGDLAVARGQVLCWHRVLLAKQHYMLARLVITRPHVQKKGMDPWILASSLPWSAQRLIALYAKRMLIEEDIRSAKSLLYWKDCRIRKEEHYRQFMLWVVATMVVAALIGFAALRKPSLCRHLVRRRKRKPDSSATTIGLRLLAASLHAIVYADLVRRLPDPT
jgi:hypothetical protein